MKKYRFSLMFAALVCAFTSSYSFGIVEEGGGGATDSAAPGASAEPVSSAEVSSLETMPVEVAPMSKAHSLLNQLEEKANSLGGFVVSEFQALIAELRAHL